jgi:hypothetical protein
MVRKKVLETYITTIIKKYIDDDGEEELVQLLMENCSNLIGWANLRPDIQNEFSNEKLEGEHNDEKYDGILRFKLRDDIKGITNTYISNQTGIEITTGVPTDLEPCPC